ncbi:ATP-binding protein [Variovorax sp. LjRoot130]|uniref:ATP-binding protein n=1 Tax=Variovorax sp. LjRoot130 TaxID=3342261 RepID=UPI003F510032
MLRLGERFYRPAGQQEGGSGLGVSIARRIAELHGLEVMFGAGANGKGVRVVLRFDAAHR